MDKESPSTTLNQQDVNDICAVFDEVLEAVSDYEKLAVCTQFLLGIAMRLGWNDEQIIDFITQSTAAISAKRNTKLKH